MRPEHAILNNITALSNSPFWLYNYPPKAWRCRCTVIPGNKSQIRNFTREQSRIMADRAKIPPYLRKNVFKDKIIFADNHPYFKKLKSELKFDKTYNLPSSEKILASQNLPSFNPQSNDTFNTWLQQQNSKKINIKGFDTLNYSLDTNIKNKADGIGHILLEKNQNRQAYTHLIPDIVQNPTEAYITKGKILKNTTAIEKTFVKYYDKNAFVVFTKDEKILTIFKAENIKQLDNNWRQGLLLKK